MGDAARLAFSVREDFDEFIGLSRLRIEYEQAALPQVARGPVGESSESQTQDVATKFHGRYAILCGQKSERCERKRSVTSNSAVGDNSTGCAGSGNMDEATFGVGILDFLVGGLVE